MENRIRINHVALWNRSEKNADTFYGELLGLEKQYQFTLDAELAFKIFGTRQPLRAIVFANANYRIEVFLSDRDQLQVPVINHICFEIKNREQFLHQCAESGIERIVIPRNGGQTVFIRDFDGNLFEIKERSNDSDSGSQG
ncbi:MAG TPA: VOC family protein [Caldithrix sp.]|nr:VOC family protein [Caldithrix sp.]